jgi:hypothetical protein
MEETNRVSGSIGRIIAILRIGNLVKNAHGTFEKEAVSKLQETPTSVK